MKKALLFLLALPVFASAQITTSTQWSWMKGDNSLDQPGIYGIQGQSNPSNRPGARDASVSWTDQSGNFWVFGGAGYGELSRGLLNDLWKFETTTNSWTWIKGATDVDAQGEYGIQGNSDALNTPGARRYSVSWIDNSGRLWLFGGEGYTPNGYGLLNDLWMFDPVSTEWTWVHGSDSPDQLTEFGDMGIPDPSNAPGSRSGSSTWVDNDGNFWLLGGLSYDWPVPSFSNDLWFFDHTVNMWTWINGSFILNTSGIYGTLGSPSSANAPGSRTEGAEWVDDLGNLWLFGGEGIDINGGSGALNDLWRYNINTDMWTWIKGDNIVNQGGIYGTAGSSSPTTNPGARFQAMNWTDPDGNFWLFGGDGYGTGVQGLLSDAWKYETSTNRWTWIKGDGTVNRSTVYGTMGTGSATTRPGGRRKAQSFTDPVGNLWLFGGKGYDATTNTDLLNDMWRLGSFAPVPVNGLVLSASYQSGKVKLTWKTEQEINSDKFIVERSNDGINFYGIGNVSAAGYSSSRLSYSFHDEQPYLINYYRIRALDKDGAAGFSNMEVIKISETLLISISPNPATEILYVDIAGLNGKSEIYISDINGKVVLKTAVDPNSIRVPINVTALAKGTYVLVVKNKLQKISKQFIVH